MFNFEENFKQELVEGKRAPILGIDLDEVVFHYISGLRNFMTAEGSTPPLTMPVDYSFAVSGWFETDSDFRECHGRAVQAGMLSTLEIIDGARETLIELAEAGYEIHFITSRFVNPGQNGAAATSTTAALERLDVPYHSLTIIHDKRLHYADLYLDDAPHNIKSLSAIGRDIVAFTVPYNEHLDHERVSNWAEFRKKAFERFGL